MSKIAHRVKLAKVCGGVWMVNGPVIARVFQMRDRHAGRGGSLAVG